MWWIWRKYLVKHSDLKEAYGRYQVQYGDVGMSTARVDRNDKVVSKYVSRQGMEVNCCDDDFGQILC